MRSLNVLIWIIYSLQFVKAHTVPNKPCDVHRIIPSLRGGDEDTNDTSTLLRSRGGSAVTTSIPNNAYNVDDDDKNEEEKQKESNFLTKDIAASGINLDEIHVLKRNGQTQKLNREKIYRRLEALSTNLNQKFLSLEAITDSIMRGAYHNMTSAEIDTLASETAASMSTQHPDYARLAARICVTQNHKMTPGTFSETLLKLYDNGNGFVSSSNCTYCSKTFKRN